MWGGLGWGVVEILWVGWLVARRRDNKRKMLLLRFVVEIWWLAEFQNFYVKVIVLTIHELWSEKCFLIIQYFG